MNAFSILCMSVGLAAAGFFLVFVLGFIFDYCLRHHLKKVYKVVLIIILVIVGLLDWILVNKEFPALSLGLVLFQLIGIPIICWYRPEYDFTEKEKNE